MSIFYITIMIMSLPILPKGVGSGLTLPLLLGQAWPSPSGSGLAPPLPFLLAGPLAFPFSPFWLAFPLGAWPTRPELPTLTRKAEKEGRPLPREGRANPTGRANPKLEKEGQPPLRKLPTPSQGGRANLHAEKEGPNPQPKKEKQKRNKTTQ